MVRKAFLKSLNDETLTLWESIQDKLLYNDLSCFIKHIFRFLKRLPKYIKLCWINESWDYEGLYNFIDMFLQELYQAQLEDTWHVPRETKRRALQIKCTLAHLDRFRNWPNYYEWPDPTMKELDDGNFTVTYNDPQAQEKMDFVHKMEQKHYEKFWKLLKQYHQGWWT
jgi:hypothetical protein